MLGIAAAVLFFISFLINAADLGTNDVFSSGNIMLLGLMCLALHVAGVGGALRTGPGPRRGPVPGCPARGRGPSPRRP
ncbi:hypothetical protein AB0957_31695, partial [Streptomyces zhihengii]|uniref:hypothetical protein n=1 Tax=Streptomyces zhihengii TaxID=1818004 RepID=UPI0034517063